METIKHVCFNIAGFERNYKGRNIGGIFEDENGNPLNHEAAKAFVAECKKAGYKYFPNPACKGFDPFKNGCPGHQIDN